MSSAPSSPTPAAPRSEARPDARRRFRWGFRTGFLGLVLLLVWGELAMTFGRAARHTEPPQRWLHALGLFLLLLPALAVVVYAWPRVVDFFRSIRVGVVNLILIGIGSIIGVLFHQEDANFPIDRQGMDQLVHWEQQEKPWAPGMRQAYKNYLDFRSAHAFFVYHLLHGLGFHALGIGADECELDRKEPEIQKRLAELDRKLPEIRDRFGEEFAVALRTQSEAGLRNRAMKAEISAFEHDANDFWWTLFVWADRLDLIRVYKADWFAVCWAVLLLGVLANLLRGGVRRLLRPAKLGFVLSHLGVILIIAGAFHGRLVEERGILDMHVGDVKDRFQLYSGPQMRLQRPGFLGTSLGAGEPFALRLDAFRADYFDVLEVNYAVEDAQGRPMYEFALDQQPTYRVWDGMVQQLDWGPAPDPAPPGRRPGQRMPWLTLEVEEYIPQARIREELRRADPESGRGHPLARVAVEESGGRRREQILTPVYDVPLVHAPSGSRVRYLLVDGEEEARALLAKRPGRRLGVLRQTGAAGGHPVVRDVVPGETIPLQVDDRTYRVRVVRATPWLRLTRDEHGRTRFVPAEGATETLEPRNPAVLLEIEGPGGEVEERWVLQQDVHLSRHQFEELRLEFQWDAWSAPARRRILLLQLPDETLVAGEVGDPESLRPVAPGDSLDLGGGARLVVEGAVRNGYLERIPEPVEGADFFHPAPGAIRLRVRTPEFDERLVLVASENEQDPMRSEWLRYRGPDGKDRRVLLVFRPNLRDLPFEWRSKLTALRPGPGHGLEEVATGVIRVNDYFVYDGFRFFQTNARANDRTYSGIGVVYDPGIPTVLAGLYMVMAGTAVAFLVNPLVTRRFRGL